MGLEGRGALAGGLEGHEGSGPFPCEVLEF